LVLCYDQHQNENDQHQNERKVIVFILSAAARNIMEQIQIREQHWSIKKTRKKDFVHIYIYVCIYMYMGVCMYVYIYIYAQILGMLNT
jgi:hypothetical protein